MEVIGGVASVVALVEVAGKIGLLCGKYIVEVRDAKDDAKRVMAEAEIFGGLMNQVEDMLNGQFGSKLQASQALKGALRDSKREDEKLKKPSLLRKMTRGLKSEDLKWPFKKKYVEAVIENLRAQKTTITLALQIDNVSMVAFRDQKTNLEKLPAVKEALFGSLEDQYEPECLPETRTEVFKGIEEWIASSRESPIFWLRGMAGTGKSTIARTVASHLQANGQLGASFFFKRSQAQRSTASKLFPTLAYSLAHNIPSLMPHMIAAIENNPEASARSLKEQFEKFIIEPLSLLDHPSTVAVVVVIDALDECESEQEILLVLGFLGQLSHLEVVNLRFFITSRPEFAPLTGFQKLTKANAHYHDLALHDVEREAIRRDIRIYLEYEFARIRDDRTDEVPENWPQAEAIQQLVDIANPLFISAATICRFVDDKHFSPAKRLDTILTAGYKAPGVYQIYLTVFEQMLASLDSVGTDRELILEESRKIVSTVAMLERPLSRRSLSELTGIELETIRYRLRPFHSILVVPNHPDIPIKTFHLSFRDYLLDPAQNSRNPFSVDEKEAHGKIASECITLMSKKLKTNICDLPSPGSSVSEIDQRLPQDLGYACQHWVHHLRRSQYGICDDGPVHEFLQEHLIHWLEATSILGISSGNLHLVKDLQKMMLDPNRTSNLSEFLHDIERFVAFNQSIIAQAPLQVYFSCLIFAPENSIVRNTFAPKYLCWVRKAPKTPTSWGPLMQTLEGHSRGVTSVAFSPDGKLLASASRDSMIKLWDAALGVLVQTLEGYKDLVTFSPDGKLLASVSASIGNEIILWDLALGVLAQKFEGGPSYIESVAFSPDGKLLASASHDKKVKLWDVVSGALAQTFEGHSGSVTSAAFSPNGKLLASTSYDLEVKLWDIASGALARTLRGHRAWVVSVVFSPDGKQLASVSHDHTVKLWNTASGALAQTIEGHSGLVNSVAFSPDGKQLASTSHDRTVKLWNAASGVLVHTFESHHDWVFSVAFSPDGKQLASASHDHTVKLWDATPGAVAPRLEGHNDSVTSIAFSPDGELLASASDDYTVKLWDAASGALTQTLKGHKNSVTSIVFSPDGELLTSASDDCTVKLWDAASGALAQTLEGDFSPVKSIAFSPDGKLLASGSRYGTVKLWYTASGTLVQTLNGHRNSVDSLVFSLDGKQLASGSKDRTVKLWDAASGALAQTLEGHIGLVTSVAFSTDGKQLASASLDGTVKLWDSASGALAQTLKGHCDWVNLVVFSPDGKLLASASSDTTIKLWDVASRVLLHTFHSGTYDYLSFSKDGQAIDTDDGQICLPRSVTNSTGPMTPQAPPYYHLKGWLTLNEEKLLWFPVQYRPRIFRIRCSLVAIGCQSGYVGTLDIDHNQQLALIRREREFH
ncbi:hypothetical protein ABW20_dc0104170 [Dactylellina cionopaga]|nr:hypothetical protein ABW20_dc0104170 [Dactylellina cionopaga]